MISNLGLLALDNVAVAAALGAAGLNVRRTAVFAVLVGTSECLMILIGTGFSGFAGSISPFVGATKFAVLATSGTAILGLVLVHRDPRRLVNNVGALAGLALVLGLDNFAAGTANGDLPGSAMVLSGVISGVLSFAAGIFGRMAAAFAPPHWGTFAGSTILLSIAAAG
jgi:putative Mn2+ efflux pump MntP